MSRWFLEGYLADGESVYRVPLNRFPALVGRQTDLAVALQSTNVSRQHAEFLQAGGQLLVRDLDSTNGTFVNHHQIISSQALSAGDVIRFADVEFRLWQETAPVCPPATADATRTAFFTPDEQVNRMPIGARQLDQLLQQKLIKPLFQPIVSASDERMTGLELLGRGCHPDLSELPDPLFFLAEGLGRSVELSEALREAGVQAWAASRFRDIPLFVNTHPRELKDCPRLIESLQALRSRHADAPLILEIHEQAVTDEGTLNTLNNALQRMHIGLAYDDFGAGQARLLELLNTPPYAVKFDITLIRDLDKLPRSRQEMIGLLVEVVKRGHTRALAEGVSHRGELAICRKLNFDLIQGFACGRPATLAQLQQASTLR
jgi:EAL domain-containing protein (putative c-di-GMP-specific phosphodiesterase class I)